MAGNEDPDVGQQVAAQNAAPSIPQDNRLAPILQQVRGAIQPGDDGSTWADPALAAIQQHANATATVDANQAVGDKFVQNVGKLKDTLVGMVRDDPTSAPLALRLTPRLVAPMVASAGMSDEDGEATHQDLTGHIQQEVSHAAVMRMADLHADGARALMGQLSPYMQPGDTDALGGYIDTMQAARVADGAARQQYMGTASARASAQSAYQFGSSLLDPRTEDVHIPPDFLQSLVRNQSISGPDKQPLFTAFSRLNSPGDVTASNPYAVRKLLSDIGNPNVPIGHADIMDHVGSDVKYADAVMLHGMSLQRTPDGQGAIGQLGGLLDHAQNVLSPGTDRAGNIAYTRFVNWLLPSYRRTGPAGLTPGTDNYLFNNLSVDNFRPQAADAVAPIRPVNQKSLGQIFAGREPGTLDEKIGRLRDLEEENQEPVAPASGNFFQRHLPQEDEPKA